MGPSISTKWLLITKWAIILPVLGGKKTKIKKAYFSFPGIPWSCQNFLPRAAMNVFCAFCPLAEVYFDDVQQQQRLVAFDIMNNRFLFCWSVSKRLIFQGVENAAWVRRMRVTYDNFKHAAKSKKGSRNQPKRESAFFWTCYGTGSGSLGCMHTPGQRGSTGNGLVVLLNAFTRKVRRIPRPSLRDWSVQGHVRLLGRLGVLKTHCNNREVFLTCSFSSCSTVEDMYLKKPAVLSIFLIVMSPEQIEKPGLQWRSWWEKKSKYDRSGTLRNTCLSPWLAKTFLSFTFNTFSRL